MIQTLLARHCRGIATGLVIGAMVAGVLSLGWSWGSRYYQARWQAALVTVAGLQAQIDILEADGQRRAQEAAQALAAAQAASAKRQPQIAALARASQAGGALACDDAMRVVRDAMRR
jgi:hypothetical protein